MEGNDSPAATPRNYRIVKAIGAKFDSASVATPVDVMARQTDSVHLEFDQYAAQALISRSSCPICWWAQHKPSYLILSSVAVSVFFPKPRQRITCNRNTLAPSKADTVIF